MGALAEGLDTPVREITDEYDGGDVAVYGLLRGCGGLIRNATALGRNFLHVDNGYFRPGHYNGYFRLSLNKLQAQFSPLDEYDHEKGVYGISPPDRWEKLDAKMRPWRRRGKNILVVPPSDFVCGWFGFDRAVWTLNTVREIQKHTARPITMKLEKGSMQDALENVWCLVTYHSLAAVHALREGIPVIVNKDHCASGISWDMGDIESPYWPEREPWAHYLAYQQWTVEEMASGEFKRAWEVS
jgi:hypothetical protein